MCHVCQNITICPFGKQESGQAAGNTPNPPASFFFEELSAWSTLTYASQSLDVGNPAIHTPNFCIALKNSLTAMERKENVINFAKPYTQALIGFSDLDTVVPIPDIEQCVDVQKHKERDKEFQQTRLKIYKDNVLSKIKKKEPSTYWDISKSWCREIYPGQT